MPVTPVLPSIDYTSRDYEAIRADLIRLIRERLPQWTANDPNDFGVALVEAVAYTADQLHYYLDRVANEAYLGTALQRESLTAIAQLLGYRPYEASSSSVVVEFTNDSSAEVVIPEKARVQALLERTDGSIVRVFETTNEVTVPANGSVTVPAIQGRTYSNEQVGVSTGLSYQRFILPRMSVLRYTISVSTVLGDSVVDWTQVERLEDASDEDRVFTAVKRSDGSTAITFGDGINGEIPALHAMVVASYRVGGGQAMVPANTIKALVDPVMPNITVNNPNPATGGRDDESLNSIRVNAARSFRARDRAVTAYDFMAVAKTYPGISKVKVVANNGVSVVAFVTAENDGSGRPTLTVNEEEGVRTFLRSAAMAGVDVTVVDTLWVPIHLDLTVACLASAKRQAVEDAVRQTLDSLFSFDTMDFDERLTVGDINAALFGIPGLAYATVNGMGISEQLMLQDPIFFDDVAVNAIPYWEDDNLTLTMEGGV